MTGAERERPTPAKGRSVGALGKAERERPEGRAHPYEEVAMGGCR